MNLPTSDVNDFSPIISCTLPSMNLSVVLTGDAGVPVFQSISMNRSKEQDFRQILEKDVSHLVLLMLPHHGSYLNVGGFMLNFFKPNVFGVSAGDGGQHGHPSLKSIEWIKSIYNRESTKFHELFLKKYEIVYSYHFIAIREKTVLSRYPHTIVKFDTKEPLFLCPNIYGCIKLDKTGIYTNFNNMLRINDNEYYVNYTSHLFERADNISDGDLNNVLGFSNGTNTQINLKFIQSLDDAFPPYKYLFKDVSDEEDIFYIGVPINGKIFIYLLVRNENNSKRKRD
ncbi:MAG: hypothetical protein HEEMFOPI_01987 [Holosporales bacterium]